MNTAIIVAAGQGLRMKAYQRKQFMQLAGRPILTHTLLAFDSCHAVDQVVLVIPAEEAPYCRENILTPAGLEGRVTMVAGGQRRQDSVYCGIESIDADEGIVLIHDGVRPLVTADMIEAAVRGAEQWGGCIPVIMPVDTPKMVDDRGRITHTIERRGMRMAQTPQAFKLSTIREAHKEAVRHGWKATDDASLVERMGVAVHTIPGSQENLKITTAHGLALAELYFSRRRAAEDRL